jgi:DNA polymerase
MRFTNFFIDWETFYDVGYSLRQQKINLTDYIRDPCFEVLGASVALGEDEPRFLSGGALKRYLDGLPWPFIRQVGHHNLFDGLILNEKFGHRPAKYFCTMGMMEALLQGAKSVGLDNLMPLVGMQGKGSGLIKGKHLKDYDDDEYLALADYANDDLRATIKLFNEFAHLLPAWEWELMHVLQRMFHEPVLQFNPELLQRAYDIAVAERKVVIDASGYTEEQLRGNISFPQILIALGATVPMKPSPTVDDKWIPALAKTDVGFQKLLESDNEGIRNACAGRLAVKSTQAITRAARFITMYEFNNLFHVGYNYYRAHTGRVTGANKMNPTNMKRKSDLRKSVIAPPDHVLVVGDSSQIEARNNGYLAGQDDLMDLFRRKEDPYNEMAGIIFGRPIDRKNNPDDFFEGFIGKTSVLGLGFQMGGPHFRETVQTSAKVDLGMDINYDLNEAYRVVNLYREKNWKIEQFWETAKQMLVAMATNQKPYDFEYPDGVLHVDTYNNKILFPSGTYLYYPLLDYSGGQFSYVNQRGKTYVNKKIYGGLVVENIVQKFARDIVMWQMLNIDKEYHCVMTTYDEVVCSVHERDADMALEFMLNELRKTPDWAKSVPLDAEGGYAKEYSK